MMQRLLLAVLFILTSAFTPANALCRTCVTEAFDLQAGIGYRSDSLEFKHSHTLAFITDNLTRKFKDLQIFTLGARGEYLNSCNFYLTGHADYGRIYDGRCIQTEVFVDDVDVFDTVIDSGRGGRGEVFDFSAGLGWRFGLWNYFLTFNPMIGYADNRQNLRGYRFERTAGLLIGEDPCELHLNHRTIWRGPWMGFCGQTGPWFCYFNFIYGYDYTWAIYRDSSHEHQIDGIRRTTHTESYGRGHHWFFGGEYLCGADFSLGFYYERRSFWIRPGKIYITLKSPTDPDLFDDVCIRGEFERGSWVSRSILITLNYHY